jgi:putative ABC transport system ATP-binding protein
MEICRLKDISKSYLTGENVCPLSNVSLSVNIGDFISIEGPSGIGKSTLLYVMGGLLKPTNGKLYLGGKDTSLLTDQQLTSLRGEKIGFIFQETNLIQALTLEENLAFAQTLGHKYKVNGKKIASFLERLGLAERKNFLPHQLSIGQRRRAIAAIALVNRPKLILADEPTNDLDDRWAGEIIKILLEMTENDSAVVMVTHNEKWAGAANIKYRLDDGQLSQLKP